MFQKAECTFSCSECLIVVVKLSTEPKAKIELKKICSAYLKYEIDKNTFANTHEDNQNLKVFLSRMTECRTMKAFSEQVVYSLRSDDYDKQSFHLWSLIADFEYNIDLSEILHFAKTIFVDSIEDYQQENEEKHALLIEQLDMTIEDSKNALHSFTELKEGILEALGVYSKMEPESKTRDILTKIVSSNYELGEKMKKIIVPGCLNVVLTPPAKEALFKFIDDNEGYTTNMLKLIEEALSASKISMFSDEVVQVKGYNVFISSVIEEVETRLADPKVKEVRIYGTNVFELLDE